MAVASGTSKWQKATLAPTPDHVQLHWAKVWVVDHRRGDLYVVSVVGGTNQFIRLTEGGIADRPEEVLNESMQVLCNSDGTVVALPCEDACAWKPCEPMTTPPSGIFVTG